MGFSLVAHAIEAKLARFTFPNLLHRDSKYFGQRSNGTTCLLNIKEALPNLRIRPHRSINTGRRVRGFQPHLLIVGASAKETRCCLPGSLRWSGYYIGAVASILPTADSRR
jgi:hypothetical protein